MIGDDDLSTIFANGDFDVEATFSNEVVVKGWFTERTDGVVILGNEIEASDPSFTTPTAGVTTIKNGMTVVISGDTYEVKRKHNLGTGVSLITLKTQ